MLPDKSIASLVKYYYSWKKAKARTGTEQQEKKRHTAEGGSENGSENGGSPNDSDIEEKVRNQILSFNSTKILIFTI